MKARIGEDKQLYLTSETVPDIEVLIRLARELKEGRIDRIHIELPTASPDEKIKNALEVIEQYGGTDGAHHKQWVIDQVVRALVDEYDQWVLRMKDGDDGADTYDWDTGVAP